MIEEKQKSENKPGVKPDVKVEPEPVTFAAVQESEIDENIEEEKTQIITRRANGQVTYQNGLTPTQSGYETFNDTKKKLRNLLVQMLFVHIFQYRILLKNINVNFHDFQRRFLFTIYVQIKF